MHRPAAPELRSEARESRSGVPSGGPASLAPMLMSASPFGAPNHSPANPAPYANELPRLPQGSAPADAAGSGALCEGGGPPSTAAP